MQRPAIPTAASTLPTAVETSFADPEWRGEQHDFARESAPLASLERQAARLEDWVRGGACYGWLDTYQSRRAAFELQSIRAQLKGLSVDAPRCAIQSRLSRLDQLLRQARGQAWTSPDQGL